MEDLKVLIVEDEVINGKILKKYITNYGISEDNIQIAENGYEAIGMLLSDFYDIMFLDVMMPKCDGIKVLDTIRMYKKDTSALDELHICMTTALGGDKNKTIYNLKGASSYIIKPIKQEIVHSILDGIVKHKEEVIEYDNNEELSDSDDDFLDFDDDFLDFDDNDEFSIDDEAQEKINHANTTHQHVSAMEFLAEYSSDGSSDEEHFYNTIDDIDELYDEIRDSLSVHTFESKKEDIIAVLSKYSSFLNTFANFYELSYAIYNMSKVVENLNTDNFNEKRANIIIRYMEALLQNLDKWKNHVFIEKDAVDVYYVNASILSDVISFEDMVKN